MARQQKTEKLKKEIDSTPGEYIMNRNVMHDGHNLKKGEFCPKQIEDEMLAKNYASETELVAKEIGARPTKVGTPGSVDVEGSLGDRNDESFPSVNK